MGRFNHKAKILPLTMLENHLQLIADTYIQLNFQSSGKLVKRMKLIHTRM